MTASDPILAQTYQDAAYKVPDGSVRRNNGYFKVYMNQLEDWWYEGATSDNDAHAIYVRFDSQGQYTLEVSGKSNEFAIDRYVLYKEGGE